MFHESFHSKLVTTLFLKSINNKKQLIEMQLWQCVELIKLTWIEDSQIKLTSRSAPSCDHFGRHGEWKKYLVTKILTKVANWRPTDLKRHLLEKLYYQK